MDAICGQKSNRLHSSLIRCGVWSEAAIFTLHLVGWAAAATIPLISCADSVYDEDPLSSEINGRSAPQASCRADVLCLLTVNLPEWNEPLSSCATVITALTIPFIEFIVVVYGLSCGARNKSVPREAITVTFRRGRFSEESFELLWLGLFWSCDGKAALKVVLSVCRNTCKSLLLISNFWNKNTDPTLKCREKSLRIEPSEFLVSEKTFL